MTTTMNSNGRARKSLAEQIDRLDGILDGLSEALQGAVAGAVTEAVGLAVKEAVRCVLAEVLASPEFLERLRQATGGSAPTAWPAAPPRPGPFRRCLRRATAWAVDRAGKVARAAREAAGALGRSMTRARRDVKALLPFRRPLLLAAAVGTAAGIAASHSTPLLAAAAAWMGGFATALSVQAAVLLRRWLLQSVTRDARTVCGRGGV